MSGVVRPSELSIMRDHSRDNFTVTFVTAKYKYHSVGTLTSHQRVLLHPYTLTLLKYLNL